MIMTSMNLWPILVSTIVAFGVSALWYSPILFGNEWMRLSGISEKDMPGKEGVWKLYVIQLIITLVMFTVMGFLISATGSRTVSDGVFLALLLWLGFSLVSAVGRTLWQRVPLKMLLIVELCTLITWLVGGAIIGAWR